jgi:hypothetical protein
MKPGRLDVPGKQLNNHAEPKLLDLRYCVIRRALCAGTSPMAPSAFSPALYFLIWGRDHRCPPKLLGNRNFNHQAAAGNRHRTGPPLVETSILF